VASFNILVPAHNLPQVVDAYNESLIRFWKIKCLKAEKASQNCQRNDKSKNKDECTDFLNFFEKTLLDWSEWEEEFIKRTAFSLIACQAWHNKETENEKFIKLLPLIKREATDGRNYVKKSVNWALRHIGKKNPSLNKAAIKAAKDIQRIDSKAARWIASDAIRELESKAVQKRLKKK